MFRVLLSVTLTNSHRANNMERFFFCSIRRRHSHIPFSFVFGYPLRGFSFPFSRWNRSIGKCGSVTFSDRFDTSWNIQHISYIQSSVISPQFSHTLEFHRIRYIWRAFSKWHIASRDYFTSVWYGFGTKSIGCQICSPALLLLSFFYIFSNKIERKFLYDFLYTHILYSISLFISWLWLSLFSYMRMRFMTWKWLCDVVSAIWNAHEQINVYAFRLRFYKNRIYRCTLCAVRFVYRFHWLLLLLSFLLSSFPTVDSVPHTIATLHQFFHLLRLVIDLCRSISIFIFPQFCEMWKHSVTPRTLAPYVTFKIYYVVHLCLYLYICVIRGLRAGWGI